MYLSSQNCPKCNYLIDNLRLKKSIYAIVNCSCGLVEYCWAIGLYGPNTKFNKYRIVIDDYIIVYNTDIDNKPLNLFIQSRRTFSNIWKFDKNNIPDFDLSNQNQIKEYVEILEMLK